MKTAASLSLALVLVVPFGATTALADWRGEIVGQVSGERIMATIEDLESFGSRAFYLNTSGEVAEYVFARFLEMGLNVMYQNFTVYGHRASNVIATIEGHHPETPQYLFGAHHDSINADDENHTGGENYLAPGADDDASGVAAIIELATLLSDMEMNSPVKFVAFAAEESGLNGSTYFVQREKLTGAEYADTVIVDMIGYRGGDANYVNFFTKEPIDELAEAAAGAVEDFGLDLELVPEHYPSHPYSDHYPFWMAGYRGVLVIEELHDGELMNPNYHLDSDTSDTLSESQMAEVTKALLAAILDVNGYREGVGIYPLIIALVFGTIIISTALLLYIRKARRIR